MSAQTFAFQPTSSGRRAAATPPEPYRPSPEPMPETEWGLSAGQVVAVVLAIVAACEIFGLMV